MEVNEGSTKVSKVLKFTVSVVDKGLNVEIGSVETLVRRFRDGLCRSVC